MFSLRWHSAQARTDRDGSARGGRPLGMYLWALILASLIPLLCFQAYTVDRSSHAEAQLAENQADRITHAISDLLDRELTELQASLAILGDAPSLQKRHFEVFHRRAREFSRHNGSGIVLLDLDGRQLVNGRLDWGVPLPTGVNQAALQRVLESKRPQVIDAFVAQHDHKERVGVARPVFIDGRIRFVLLASWTLDDIAAKLQAAPLPADWPALVVDANGVRIWRPGHPELLGKAVDPAFLQQLLSGHTKRIESIPTGDQVEVVNFTSRLRRANWIAVIGVPRTVLRAPLYNSLALLSSAGIVTLMLGLLIANWISRQVSDEVDAVAAAAERLEQGAPPSVLDLKIRELRGLGAAIVAAGFRRSSAEMALRASEERWKFALEGAGDGVWDWNVQSGAVLVSPRYASMLGLAENEVGSHVRHWIRRIHPDDRAPLRNALHSYFGGTAPSVRVEYRMRHQDQRWIWVVSRGMLASRTDDGKPLRMIGTTTDIHERKRMEEELVRLATTDHLTGLANRRSFITRLEEELARLQRRDDVPATVMMLDLDHFKRINDTHGHAAGDAMLVHFANLISESPRKIDLVSRLGGEEFAILLVDAAPQAAVALAERLCEWVARHPLQYQGQAIALTVSIGIAALRTSDASAAAALSRADAALYQAKKRGRNRVEIASNEASDRPLRRSD